MKEDKTGWQRIIDAVPRKRTPPWQNLVYTIADVTGETLGKGLGNLIGSGIGALLPKPRPFTVSGGSDDPRLLYRQLEQLRERINADWPDPSKFLIGVFAGYHTYCENEHRDLPTDPLLHALGTLILDLLSTPMLANVTEESLRASGIEGARARDTARALIHCGGNHMALLQQLRLTSLSILIAFDPHIPAVARLSIDETVANDFKVRFLDLIDNAGDAFTSLIAPLYHDNAANLINLTPVRQQLNANLNDTPEKHRDPLSYPGSSADIIHNFLQGTPFEALFQTPIPFALTRYKNKHWAIYGRTGHGKTQLLQSLILSHLQEPDPPPMIVIDSQGQMLRNIEQLALFDKLTDRLVVVDAQAATPPALNLFSVPSLSEEAETEVIGLYQYIFSALDADLTRRQSTMFTFVTQLMLKHDGATIRDLLKLLEEGRGSKLKFNASQSAYYPTMCRLDPVAQDYFANRFFDTVAGPTKEQLSTRLYALLSVKQVARMFDTPTNDLNLFDAIDKRKVVLVNTAGLGEWTPLFGRAIIALALQAAFRRDIRKEPHPALLFIDEAFELMDEKINKILIQARKFGLFIRFATQQYEQIPLAVRAAASANTEVKLAGGLSATDARSLAPDMRTDTEFLLGMRKLATATEFACFVQNDLERAVKLTVPFGRLEAEPRRQHDAAALRAVLAARPVTPRMPPQPTSPAADFAPKKNLPTEW